MFIKHELLAAINGFDPAFGVSGSKRGYGEEDDLLQRLCQHQPDAVIYYDPALYVHHLVRPEKMRLGWQLYDRFLHGRYSYRVYAEKTPVVEGKRLQQRLPEQLSRFINCYLLGLGGLVRGARARYPYYQQFLCEEVGADLQRLGWFVEYWQQQATNKS